MSNALSTTADIGKFLILAAIVPGLVYTMLFIVLFPDNAAKLNDWFKLLGFSAVWPFWVILPIMFGLLLSSICFAIEINIRKIETKLNKDFMKKRFPPLKVSSLARIEGKGSSTSYLNQLLGQSFMHFNIFAGSLFIWIVYLIFFIFIWTDQPIIKICDWSYSWVMINAGVVTIIVANYIVSRNLYTWADGAIKRVMQDCGIQE